MHSLQERVAYLEDRVTDTSALAGELRQDFRDMRAEVHRDVNDLRGEVGRLEAKIDRNFIWTMGAQLTTLLAVIGALLAPYFRSA